MVRQVIKERDHSVIQTVSGSWISGLQKCYRTISAHRGSEMLAVQWSDLAYRRGYSDQSHLVRQ